jgi:hypothetical protein
MSTDVLRVIAVSLTLCDFAGHRSVQQRMPLSFSPRGCTPLEIN